MTNKTIADIKAGIAFSINAGNVVEETVPGTYNNIAFTVDILEDNPKRIRLFALRSFGESLYHSITDASLEFGYKTI